MTAVIIVSAIGLLCAILLVLASHFLAVPVDTRAEDIRSFLPGANCGACGYAGCDDYAKAVARGDAKPTLCIPGGAAASEQISAYLGVAAENAEPQKAVVRCSGTCEKCGDAMDDHGPDTCAACAALDRGKKACGYGCLGYGDCVKVCQFGALSIRDGVAHVEESLCTGCGACAKACAQGAIAYGKDRKAVIDAEKCVGCGRCLGHCNFDAIHNRNWNAGDLLNRKMAEYTKAVLAGRPSFHISMVIDISPSCDCCSTNDAPILPDIGMFASFDPVALDQACADACNRQQPLPNSQLAENMAAPGFCDHHDHFINNAPETDWRVCLEHAEKVGVGTRAYELVRVK